jgi:hypothetical protein
LVSAMSRCAYSWWAICQGFLAACVWLSKHHGHLYGLEQARPTNLISYIPSVPFVHWYVGEGMERG